MSGSNTLAPPWWYQPDPVGANGLAPPRIEPQQGVTLADATDYNVQQAGDYIARQRAEAERLGLWDPQTGMPTAKGLMAAGGEYGNALMMGTTAPGIRAYHGSPHDFERFDTSKIGTGEGQQVFGHGLYFAENEATARSYRDNLANRDYGTTTGGRIPDWVGNSVKQIEDQFGRGSKLYGETIDRHLSEFQSRIDETKAEAQTSHQPWLAEGRLPHLQEIYDSIAALRSGEASLLPRGRMYEVNVRADPEHMLDWDRPLSEQSQFVKDVLAGRGPVPEGPGGKYVADYARSWAARHEAAPGGKYDIGEGEARLLRQAGIPGIRYLDQGSRGSGQGTSNYVVFDDSIIDILRKYGIAGLMAGGGAAALTGTQRQSEP